MTVEEEVAVLVRAAEAGAFDSCFERNPSTGGVRYHVEADDTAVRVAIGIIERGGEHMYFWELLGSRGANLVWDAAFASASRNLP